MNKLTDTVIFVLQNPKATAQIRRRSTGNSMDQDLHSLEQRRVPSASNNGSRNAITCAETLQTMLQHQGLAS